MIQIFFLLVFCVVSVITFKNIKTGFALVIACRLLVPRVVRIGGGGIDLSFGSCMTFMLIGVLLLNVFILKKKENVLFPKHLFFPFIVFISGLLFASFFGLEQGLKIRLFSLFEFIYTDFFLAFMAIYLFNKQEDIKRFFKIIMYTACLMGIYGIFNYIAHANPYITVLNASYGALSNALDFFMEEQRGGLSGRVMGTMLHPLAWGAVSSILFMQFFIKKLELSKPVKIGFIFIFFLNAFFSGSRSALLATILGGGYIVWISGIQIKLKAIAYVGLLLLVGMIALYQVPQLKQFQPFFESTLFFWDDSVQTNSDIKGSSADGRYEQFLGAIKMVEKNPVFGLGQGYIKYYIETFGIHPVLLGFESIVFTAIVENGFFGLFWWGLFFLLLYRMIGKITTRLYIRDKFDAVVLKSMIVSYGLFIIFTNLQSVLYLFFVLLIIHVKWIIVTSQAYVQWKKKNSDYKVELQKEQEVIV